MPPPVDEKYKELLCPIKDPEKSFAVNISELLASYVDNFRQGTVPPNFNSAALLIQGSSSIYGKKVEYLYNLALSLHENLSKHKNGGDHKKKDPKDRAPRQAKLVDPFCSTEIKPGKNLSFQNKKNALKRAIASSKKSQKKGSDKTYSFVPVDLLPLEQEEKGEVFHDTYGDPIGNSGDYTLNKCRVTTSGWLLLPTISPELVSDLSITSDYSASEIVEEDDNRCDSDVDIADTPADEGYPASSACPSSAPGSQVGSSQATDEGLGSLQSTPSDGASQPVEAVMIVDPDLPMEGVDVAEGFGDPAVAYGIENIPLDGADENVAERPVRRSMRQALRTKQLNQEEPVEKKIKKSEMVAFIKAIEKENTCHLPSKLRTTPAESSPLHPASVFCARTFFSLDTKFLKSDLLSLKVTAFANNSKFINQIIKYKEAIKAAKAKANGGEPDDDDDIEVDGIEDVLQVPDADCEPPHPQIDFSDLEIHKSPTHSFGGDELPFADEIPTGAEIEGAAKETEGVANEIEGAANEIVPESSGELRDEFERLAKAQTAMYKNDLQNYVRTSEVSEKVRVWQKRLAPFLREISSREKFDIDLYGSHILNAFDDSNRRQTIVFRDFCKGKEKWEIHRYFMALLPLANMGNVNLENEPRDDGEDDDTLITLLSRKMHHLELEEFGHNTGEHS